MSKVRNITPLPHANFTPEPGNYKTLQPFRYWCQKVLPLVYDDSLSYYELLCKVVDYLNKTMEDVETLHGDVTNLHTAYEELQTYVNNYFSTLDVQEEINNKLDQMAEDGTLAALMGKYLTRVYNTFDDVPKNIENITYTVLGRHKINDGGDGLWVTTKEVPSSNYYEKYGDIYHILIQSPLNAVSAGCVDINGNIDVDKLNSLKPRNGITFPSGYYYANKTISTTCSIYGTPISLPTLSHISGEVSSFRTASNVVIDSTADIAIQVNDSCCVENIIFVGHSYKQTEHRELILRGNEQPVYSKYETGSQTGIYLHDYGSRAYGCAVYYFESGIKCDYYAKINDCFVFQCKYGIYILANDNNVINTRIYDCMLGVYITGVLNTLMDVRCDGISGKGIVIQGNANDITNYCCDFSYMCALHIIGDNNTVNTIRMRCCAKYPNTNTQINEENYGANCGIAINGRSNKLINIPSTRPDISDTNNNIKTMYVIIGLVSGSSFTNVDFIPTSRNTTPLKDLIMAVSGNCPATIFKSIFNYYSASFTKADNVNVLIVNNTSNTKESNPPKGTTYYDGRTWFIFNGTNWDQL